MEVILWWHRPHHPPQADASPVPTPMPYLPPMLIHEDRWGTMWICYSLWDQGLQGEPQHLTAAAIGPLISSIPHYLSYPRVVVHLRWQCAVLPSLRQCGLNLLQVTPKPMVWWDPSEIHGTCPQRGEPSLHMQVHSVCARLCALQWAILEVEDEEHHHGNQWTEVTSTTTRSLDP